MSDGRDESPGAKAFRELAELQERTEEARVTLARLQKEVADAGGAAGHEHAATLVEANEQLVHAMLRAQTDAEGAAQALKKVSRAAGHDALTGLPTRVLLLDRLARAIANAKRHQGRLAVLFLDLDKFKQINDTFGHAVGDQVLKRAAECLLGSIREADTVSRHGGDEFLILLTEISQAADASPIAEKMIAALQAPNRVGEREFQLAASIGISIYPDDGGDGETLIERADAAMYRAKRQGAAASSSTATSLPASGS